MIKEFRTTLVDIIYPKNCHICSKILKGGISAFDENICLECVKDMKKAVPMVSPARLDAPYSKLAACYNYEGPVRELIHKFKYENRPYLAQSIARLIFKAINPSLFERIDCLMPVPLHQVRTREREFNQSERIARALSPLFKKPVSLSLKKIRNTPSQTTFKESERFSNLKNAFAVTDREAILEKSVLIIDDVITTKATVTEASRILKNAGAKTIHILAFAKG
jgi:ComF family protein